VLCGIGLLAAIYVAPVVLAVIAVLVWIGLPKPQAPRVRPPTVRVSPFDRRMWPFLTTGFVMYLALGIVLMTIGFLVQDRLHLSAQETGRTTGLVMLAAASLIIIVQAAVVPRLGWAPLRLMRAGAVVMTAGMVLVTVATDGPLLGAGMAVLGAGLGFGLPGIMSAPTLLATREEQGAVAGLVGATNALTFVLGPLLGTALYEIAPAGPYLLGAVLLAGVAVFTFVHPGVRQTPATAPVMREAHGTR
jgi:MFS family permease